MRSRANTLIVRLRYVDLLVDGKPRHRLPASANLHARLGIVDLEAGVGNARHQLVAELPFRPVVTQLAPMETRAGS